MSAIKVLAGALQYLAQELTGAWVPSLDLEVAHPDGCPHRCETSHTGAGIVFEGGGLFAIFAERRDMSRGSGWAAPPEVSAQVSAHVS